MVKRIEFIILVFLCLFFLKPSFAEQQPTSLSTYENKWRQVVNSLRTSLDKIIKENQSHRSQIDSLERRKSQLEEVIAQTRQENQELRGQLKGYLSDKKIAPLRKQISEIKNKNKALKKQITALNKEKNLLGQKMSSLNRQIQSLDDEIMELKQERSGLDSTENKVVSTLESDLLSSANTIRQLEGMLKESEQENLNYHKKIKGVKEDLEDIQRINSELQKENAYLSQRYIEQKDKNEQKRIDQKQATGKSEFDQSNLLAEKNRQIDKLNNDLSRLKKEKAMSASLVDLYSNKLSAEDESSTKVSQQFAGREIEGVDHETLGYVFALKGKYEQALEQYLLALRENPKNKNILYNLGYTYAKLNNFKDAAIYYRRALKIDSRDREICYNLYIIYDKLGNKSKSQRYYNRYLKLK